MVKVAIVTRKMIIGGVERALIAMLRQFDYSKFEVDLYVSELGGELEAELPGGVHLIKLCPITFRECLTHPLLFIQKINSRAMLLSKHSYIMQCYYSSKLLKPVEKSYDIAISYHAPNTIPVFFTIDGIKAKKKILWLHGDLNANEGLTNIARKYHIKFDRVFAVSQAALESFVKIHPDRAGCADIFYNFVDIKGIQEKAKIAPSFIDEFEGTRIVTVGRLEFQKGYDWAVGVCKRLINDGYNIRWYVCGDGSLREKLLDSISEMKLENQFILLGNQINPYGYMKNCDLYVQPSRFEGYCTTTNEALMLGKPVITTDVSGAREQFVHERTGWIVGLNSNDIYEQIRNCLEKPWQVEDVANNLKKIDFRRSSEIDKLFY